MNRFQKLLLLFKTTFFISMSANSGYAILSVMKNTFVDKYGWFREEEMADYIAPKVTDDGMYHAFKKLGLI